jgi:SAM-dependent methyltransferase
MRLPPERILPQKREKIERIRKLIRPDAPCIELDGMLDCMTESLKASSGIVDTSAVSSNNYGKAVETLIHQFEDGLILDCGSGQRSVCYSNVVTLDVVPYDTTDVRAVGEALPFLSNSFDAVLSLAVLEHVRQPFECAREICRVLKPGGTLLCVVPFLSPLHGYPNHYYNMSGPGLRALFEPALQIDSHWVPDRGLPITTLTWILNSWAQGLTGEVKEDFLNRRVRDLISPPDTYWNEAFVRDLSSEKNFELACTTFLRASKPA